jgi:hypothetical protein
VDDPRISDRIIQYIDILDKITRSQETHEVIRHEIPPRLKTIKTARQKEVQGILINTRQRVL